MVAFHNTLPDNSATRKALAGYEVELPTMLLGLNIDSIRELHMGFAKKRMTDSQRLYSSFDGKENRKKKEMAARMKRAKYNKKQP